MYVNSSGENVFKNSSLTLDLVVKMKVAIFEYGVASKSSQVTRFLVYAELLICDNRKTDVSWDNRIDRCLISFTGGSTAEDCADDCSVLERLQ